MKQNKELLLKDLCARLPYKVKCYGFQMKIDGNDNECYGILKNISDCDSGWKFILSDRVPLNDRKCYEEVYCEVKPYLFPLSSMTEEQIAQLEFWAFMKEYHKITDFYYENHIDFRGFIEKSLALDATNLNIY